MSDQKLFSFEFSAPKTEEAVEKVKKVHARLAELAPNGRGENALCTSCALLYL